MWPWPWAPLPLPLAIRDVGSGSSSNPIWIGTSRTWLVFQGPARLGMGFAAGFLLLVCSLMAGLILAVCGLDETILKMKSVTSTGKTRYGLSIPAIGFLVARSRCFLSASELRRGITDLVLTVVQETGLGGFAFEEALYLDALYVPSPP